ncbi:MAG: hypothetical protein JSR82_09050 [Verrucomicrobia bacterium]|nr:hypothetical protein [Verrucomicrobiota bacterium]
MEKTYADFLRAVAKEDASLLLAVLPAARIAELKETFALNGMNFPADYFRVMRELAPKMPPTTKFRFVAVTESAKFANLIYVGNMAGYLRKTSDERRFLIIQFERAPSGWKYAVMIDPPESLVPDLAKQLESARPDFVTKRPFAAEKIELVP